MFDPLTDSYLIKRREVQSDFKHHFTNDGKLFHQKNKIFPKITENPVSHQRELTCEKFIGDRDIKVVLNAHARTIPSNSGVDVVTNIIIKNIVSNKHEVMAMQMLNKLTVKQLNTHWLNHDTRSCLRVKEGNVNPYYEGQFIIHVYNFTPKPVNIEPGAAIAELHVTEFEYNMSILTFIPTTV